MRLLLLTAVLLFTVPACTSETSSEDSTATNPATTPSAGTTTPSAGTTTPSAGTATPAAANTNMQSTLDFTPGSGIDDAELADYLVTVQASIDGEDAGKMVFEFWPEKAPVSVRNFMRHASEGFYDGVVFHRILPNFMIQGGDPTGTGRGSGKFGDILGEFIENPRYGLKDVARDPKYKHTYGVLSMARSNSPDSGSCQFFICNGNASSLDGKYASFGFMIEGKATLDAITSVPRDFRGREQSVPKKKCVIEKMTVSKKDS